MIVADESVDMRLIKSLEKAGYSVFSILRESPGIPDVRVIEIGIERLGLSLLKIKILVTNSFTKTVEILAACYYGSRT